MNRKAGRIALNHNQTMAPGLKLKMGVMAGADGPPIIKGEQEIIAWEVRVKFQALHPQIKAEADEENFAQFQIWPKNAYPRYTTSAGSRPGCSGR
ncbi:MAG TPA: hypothetical protein VJ810_28260 [Blastocatellia bacterium]|nr:hypothetical protein [Blastocatellia bacterium]